jgi:hypothetical protein
MGLGPPDREIKVRRNADHHGQDYASAPADWQGYWWGRRARSVERCRPSGSKANGVAKGTRFRKCRDEASVWFMNAGDFRFLPATREMGC